MSQNICAFTLSELNKICKWWGITGSVWQVNLSIWNCQFNYSKMWDRLWNGAHILYTFHVDTFCICFVCLISLSFSSFCIFAKRQKNNFVKTCVCVHTAHSNRNACKNTAFVCSLLNIFTVIQKHIWLG